MPVADRRRQNTPLSPSEFFHPRNEPLTRSKKFRLALKNWLNGLPMRADEDVLRGIESEQALTTEVSSLMEDGSPRRRRRHWFGLRKRKREQTETAPVPAAENGEKLADEASAGPGTSIDETKKPRNPANDEERAGIRIIQVPAPHPHHHHLLWMQHHVNGGDKRDDINPYRITNRIKTAKYSLVTFLPKNLFEQFRRVANFYFLFIVILQAFPMISNYNVGLAALPLIVIVSITAVKDACEDYKRYRSDQKVNYAKCRVLHRPDTVPLESEVAFEELNANWLQRWLMRARKAWSRRTRGRSGVGSPLTSHLPLEKCDWRPTYWQDVRVGDLLLLENDEMIPADILILGTSEPDSACYVETKNLDGETNLKVKKGPSATAWIQSANDAADFRAQLEIELPSSNLFNFCGRLLIPRDQEMMPAQENTLMGKQKLRGDEEEWREARLADEQMAMEMGSVVPVDTSGLLLRGCILRNTTYVIGVVLYTGPHTKLMLNAGGTPSKRSRIERQMNPQIIMNFVLLFVICLACAIVQSALAAGPMSTAPYWVSSFGDSSYTSAYAGFLTFWSSVILFQTLVPISLYLTVELCKTAQAFLIHSDVDMYHRETDKACVPRAWNLSDDLGQIEYLFSDKTGTLTRNIMEFRRVSIAGQVYGLLEAPAGGNIEVEHGQVSAEKLAGLEDEMTQSLRSLLPYEYIPPTRQSFVDPRLISDLEAGGPAAEAIIDLFTLLIVCHTVLIERIRDEEDQGSALTTTRDPEITPHRLLFKAQSPDEAALLATARDLGFVFLGREQDIIRISALGRIEEVRVLTVIEFNSTRKRMSIIVKRADGRILLYTKGADNVIYERLRAEEATSTLGQVTLSHLEVFAEAGLRTLCLAWRQLTDWEYRTWRAEYDSAAAALHDRETLVEAVCDGLETGLCLLGATAIEDQLQEGVPAAIECLQRAGIRIWVLTGDKLETAINIGFACKLLHKNMLLLTVRSTDPASTREQLRAAYERIWRRHFTFGGVGGEPEGIPDDDHVAPEAFALIIEGTSLKHAFDPACRRLFLDLASRCTAVICCRVSPLQKAKVVELVKRGRNAMTLAIGDGANDVSMLQAADIGVGIAGQEGMQAVMSSDYAIAQFRFLAKLLLVHGRWSYIRTAEVTLISFYKNIFFVVLLFWFQFYCGFTAEYVYDYMYLVFFNLIFTVVPLLVLGVADRDLEAKTLTHVPPVYSYGIKQKSYSMRLFGLYVLDALYQSLICFFVPLAAYSDNSLTMGGDTENKSLLGNVMALAVITSCNLYMLINTYSWTWLTFVAIPIAIFVPCLFLILYNLIPSQDLYGTARVLLQPIFWATISLSIVLALTPRLLAKFIQSQWRPTDIDICREACKYGGQAAEERLYESVSHQEQQQEMDQVARRASTEISITQPPKALHRDTSRDLEGGLMRPSVPSMGASQSQELQPAPLRRSQSSFFAESLRRRLLPLGTARSGALRVFNLRTGRFEKIGGFAYSQDEGMRGLIEGRARPPLGRELSAYQPAAAAYPTPKMPPSAANSRRNHT